MWNLARIRHHGSKTMRRLTRWQKTKKPPVYAKCKWVVCASTAFSSGGTVASICCNLIFNWLLLEAVAITSSCMPWNISAADLNQVKRSKKNLNKASSFLQLMWLSMISKITLLNQEQPTSQRQEPPHEFISREEAKGKRKLLSFFPVNPKSQTSLKMPITFMQKVKILLS